MWCLGRVRDTHVDCCCVDTQLWICLLVGFGCVLLLLWLIASLSG